MHNNSAVNTLTDLELIEQICSTDDSIAYGVFVERFLPEVRYECERKCVMRKLDLHIGQQIAHETFEKVRKYKSFKKDNIKLTNDRKAILVYLYTISTNLFNDYSNKVKQREITHKTYFEALIEDADVEINVLKLKNSKDIAVKLFKSLNKKEQTVVLKDIEYKRDHRYLPDEILEELAESLDVKKSTIRKIRERAITKLKAAINEINQN